MHGKGTAVAVGCVAGLGGLYILSGSNFLLFHCLVEMFGVAVASGIFLIAWNTRTFADNRPIQFLGAVFLCLAPFDILHTLAYRGMNIFPGYDANLPTQLWIASRYILSLSLIAMGLTGRRMPPMALVLPVYIGIASALLVTVFGGWFPYCYVEGIGLTPFKVWSEYAVCLMFGVGLVLLLRRRDLFPPEVLRHLAAAIVLGAGSDLVFTLYGSVYDFANVAGHFFKFASYWFTSIALVDTCLREPYGMLFRDLKLREESLRVKAGLLDLANVLVRGLDDRIILFNGGAEQLYGWSVNEAVGVVSHELLKTRFPSPLEVIRAELMRAGRWQGELVQRRKDGEEVAVASQWVLYRDETGEPTAILEVNNDITALRRLREELARSRDELDARVKQRTRELQDFVHIASHDLREPIRKIIAFGERLRTSCAASLDEEGLDFLCRMEKASVRMSDLLDSLLTYARVASRPSPMTPVDLTGIVTEVRSDLTVRLEETGGRVEIGPLPSVIADRAQIRQVFQNLVGNALKFHKPDVPPVVRVRLLSRNGDGMCELAVEDNGIGFDEKYLEKIFQPFERLHGRCDFEGTGMGLAIVRRILTRHQGAVTAHSQPGKGSTFLVRLPVSGPTEPADLAQP